MSTVHIVREPDDPRPFETAGHENSRKRDDACIILIHDAVYAAKKENGILTFVLKDDVKARAIKSDYEQIDYKRMVDIIFEYDRVITW